MKTYNSIEDLREHGGNTALYICVSSVLACNKHMVWKLLSCSEDGTACRADFICQDDARGFVSRLSYELNELGQFGHVTVEDYHAPAVTK